MSAAPVRPALVDKPPYTVPSMAQIAATEPNGYRVASLFAGCGGSCLGYRIAGFRVVWASEFVCAAQETYRANHPETILDGRDIRSVQTQEICAATGLAVGDLDVLDGSPPCASFSTAGKREGGWGVVKDYSDTRQRTDDLFYEYARILKGLQPKVFVAENVAGLVRGRAKGYFKLILAELRSCGYKVEARLLDAQWLGVPQMRQRLIFVGVRNDIAEQFGIGAAFPKPLPYRYRLRDACRWIVPPGAVRPNCQDQAGPPAAELAECDISRYAIAKQWEEIGPGQTHPKRFNLSKPDPDLPCYTITASGGNFGTASVVHPYAKRKLTIGELKRISSFPDDFILTGPYIKQYERIGRAVPPVMMYHIAKAIRDEILSHVNK